MAAKDEMRRPTWISTLDSVRCPKAGRRRNMFWKDLAAAASPGLMESVDFVGHNFYVDVFEEQPELASVAIRVEELLRAPRRDHLVAAGISPTVPLPVTENGWPTGISPLTNTVRTPERQV